MNPAHIHLLVNHIPIIGLFAMTGMLLAGLLMKRKILADAALVGLVVVGLSLPAVYNSGEGAEEIIEKVDPSAEEYLDVHEDQGELAVYIAAIPCLLALTTLLVSRKKEIPLMPWLVLVSALAAFAFTAQAGSSGGKIRHPEVRPGFVLPAGGDGDHGESGKH